MKIGRMFKKVVQLLANALVARILGEDAFNVLARHTLIPLRK